MYIGYNDELQFTTQKYKSLNYQTQQTLHTHVTSSGVINSKVPNHSTDNHTGVHTFYHATACNAMCSFVKAFLSICPPIRPSVKCVHCDKTKEICAHILIPYDMKECLSLFSDVKKDW